MRQPSVCRCKPGSFPASARSFVPPAASERAVGVAPALPLPARWPRPSRPWENTSFLLHAFGYKLIEPQLQLFDLSLALLRFAAELHAVEFRDQSPCREKQVARPETAAVPAGRGSVGIKRVEIGKSHALGHCAQYARTFFVRKKNPNEKQKNHEKICTTGNFRRSHRHLWRSARRMTPVDSFQQHGELRYGQRNRWPPAPVT
jgi:hypothetical protein